MKVRNLHITLTPCTTESRLLRETASLLEHGIVNEVVIAALHEDGLPQMEVLGERRQVWRISLSTRKWPRNLLSQLMKYIELSWRVWRRAKANRFAVVNVHSLALLPIGVLLKFSLGARLVYDAHELETEVEGLTGIRKGLAKLLERTFVRYSDLVIVVSEGIRQWYIETYRIDNVVCVLNCPRHPVDDTIYPLRSSLGIPENRTVVLYLGGLMSGRGVERLLEAFRSAPELDMDLVFVGYGDLAEAVNEASMVDKRVHLHPAVPSNQVVGYARAADVGVALIEDSCLSYHLCLPNKLFEYSMAGLPSVVSNLPEMTALVSRYGIGVVVDNMTKVVEALEHARTLDKQSLERNLAAFNVEYSWERQEVVMADAYRTFGVV